MGVVLLLVVPAQVEDPRRQRLLLGRISAAAHRQLRRDGQDRVRRRRERNRHRRFFLGVERLALLVDGEGGRVHRKRELRLLGEHVAEVDGD